MFMTKKPPQKGGFFVTSPRKLFEYLKNSVRQEKKKELFSLFVKQTYVCLIIKNPYP